MHYQYRIIMENRRSFLKKGLATAAAAPLLATGCKPSQSADKYGIEPDLSIESTLIVPKLNALPIAGTSTTDTVNTLRYE